MINYNKNELINPTLDKYYETFSHMLDTNDYVEEKYNLKIGKYIFKNLKKTFKLVDKEDKKYQKQFRKKVKLKEKLKRDKEFKKKGKSKLKEFWNVILNKFKRNKGQRT